MGRVEPLSTTVSSSSIPCLEGAGSPTRGLRGPHGLWGQAVGGPFVLSAAVCKLCGLGLCRDTPAFPVFPFSVKALLRFPTSHLRSQPLFVCLPYIGVPEGRSLCDVNRDECLSFYMLMQSAASDLHMPSPSAQSSVKS